MHCYAKNEQKGDEGAMLGYLPGRMLVTQEPWKQKVPCLQVSAHTSAGEGGEGGQQYWQRLQR